MGVSDITFRRSLGCGSFLNPEIPIRGLLPGRPCVRAPLTCVLLFIDSKDRDPEEKRAARPGFAGFFLRSCALSHQSQIGQLEASSIGAGAFPTCAAVLRAFRKLWALTSIANLGPLGIDISFATTGEKIASSVSAQKPWKI